MPKYQGTITITFGCKEYKKLMEAYQNGRAIKIETDYYSGSCIVLNARTFNDRSDVKTEFTIREA